MYYLSRSDDIAILDFLNIFHDQLILGHACNDLDYLHQLLKDTDKVESHIHLFARFRLDEINLLFRCLETLNSREDLQPLISQILVLIYTHCYNQLNVETKSFIANYTALSEDQLNSMIEASHSVLYYSDSVKRRKIEPEQNNQENDKQSLKKHDLDTSETDPIAKRQKTKKSSRSNKRRDGVYPSNFSKRTRFFE